MRKIGAVLAIAAFAAFFVPTESQAFGIRLGPFYFGVPSHWHRHGHHGHHAAELRDDATSSTSSTGPAPARGLMSPLIYPVLALPPIYGQIFSPPAPWPLGYDAILQTAFAKAAADQNANSCPQPGNRPVIADRIRSQIRPASEQMPQLQKLGGAMSFASSYLAKACPADIPQDPAARLQLMEWQIEKIAEALDIVRQPLQDFEQTLTDAQRKRFAAPARMASAKSDAVAPACVAAPTKVDNSVEQISLSVEPTDAQRDAMNNLRQAFHNAANELDANCPASLPPDPLARLEASQSRLDATWRALVSIQVALANLEQKLTGEQRARLDATDFAAAQ